MRVNIINALLGLLLLLFLPGCATLVSGSKQDIKIASKPEGSNFKVEQLTVSGPILYLEGMTPSSVSFNRKNSYLVTLSQQGYESEEIPVEYGRQNGWIWLNFITFPLGTVIGIVIDSSTGAAITMEPEEVNANLVMLPFKAADEIPSVKVKTESNNINIGNEVSHPTGKE